MKKLLQKPSVYGWLLCISRNDDTRIKSFMKLTGHLEKSAVL